MTGRRDAGDDVSGTSGVQILRERQSSLCDSDPSRSAGLAMPGTESDWGAIGPKDDAAAGTQATFANAGVEG